MVKPATPSRTLRGPLSMTGFASISGSGHGHDWLSEIRSVNGKGFDLRLRLPEVARLEAATRAALSHRVSRGNIQLSLKLARTSGGERLRLSGVGLAAALSALREVEEAARLHGVSLAPSRATDLLSLR